jgi:hypothetical protein
MGIAPGPIYQRQKPVRDPQYLKFIRSLPSAKSGRGGCEAVHTGPHGLSQKSSDLNCIPLTRQEHREYGADPRGCEKRWKIDLAKLIARLNRAYELKTGRAA